MDAPTLTISKEEAKQYYEEYLEAIKTRKANAEKYLEDMKQVYFHLSKGHRVLDIFEVFKASGVNEQGEPNLAICRADVRTCRFIKRPLGSGRFDDGSTRAFESVSLPSGTFPNWKTEKGTEAWQKDRDIIVRQEIETTVPIVPAHFLPEGKLDNYFILWEAKDWVESRKSQAARMGDPFLLRRINDNAFVVLAEWDLTEIEQAVVRGL